MIFEAYLTNFHQFTKKRSRLMSPAVVNNDILLDPFSSLEKSYWSIIGRKVTITPKRITFLLVP